MLLLLSHVSMGRRAIFDGDAAVDTKIYLLFDYVYDGYVNMNYPSRNLCCQAALGRNLVRALCAHTLSAACLYMICCGPLAVRPFVCV